MSSTNRTESSQPENDNAPDKAAAPGQAAGEKSSETAKAAEKAKWSLGDIFSKLESIESGKGEETPTPSADKGDNIPAARKLGAAKPLGQKPTAAAGGIKPSTSSTPSTAVPAKPGATPGASAATPAKPAATSASNSSAPSKPASSSTSDSAAPSKPAATSTSNSAAPSKAAASSTSNSAASSKPPATSTANSVAPSKPAATRADDEPASNAAAKISDSSSVPPESIPPTKANAATASKPEITAPATSEPKTSVASSDSSLTQSKPAAASESAAQAKAPASSMDASEDQSEAAADAKETQVEATDSKKKSDPPSASEDKTLNSNTTPVSATLKKEIERKELPKPAPATPVGTGNAFDNIAAKLTGAIAKNADTTNAKGASQADQKSEAAPAIDKVKPTSASDEATFTPMRVRHKTQFVEPDSETALDGESLLAPADEPAEPKISGAKSNSEVSDSSLSETTRPTAEVRAVDLDPAFSLRNKESISSDEKWGAISDPPAPNMTPESSSGDAQGENDLEGAAETSAETSVHAIDSQSEFEGSERSSESAQSETASPIEHPAASADLARALDSIPTPTKSKTKDLIPNVEHPRLTASGLTPLQSSQPSTQFVKASTTGTHERFVGGTTSSTSEMRKNSSQRFNWRQEFFGKNKGPRKFEDFVAAHQLEILCGSFLLMSVSWAYCISHEAQVEKLISQIKRSFANKDYDEALATAKKAIKQYPNVGDFHFYKGKVYLKAHQKNLAMKEFESATEGNVGDDLEKLNFRAKLYADQQQYQKAIDDYDVLLKSPSYAVAYNFANRGFCRMMLGNYAGAVADFDLAIKLDPKTNSYYTSRAFANAGLYKYRDALNDFSTIIKHDPKDASAYAERGNIQYQLHNTAAAVDDLTKSLNIKPTSRAYFYRGLVHRDAKDIAGAINDFHQALKIDPNNAQVHETLGYTYSMQGDFGKAVSEFDTALLNQPGQRSNDFLKTYAQANMETGHHAKATKAYGEVLAKAPDDRAIRQLHALCAERAGEFSKAYDDYTYLIDKDPNNAELHVQRAKVSVSQRKFDLANADFERAIAISPRYLDTYYYRALAYADQNMYDNALLDLTHVLKEQPNNALVKHKYGEIAREKASHTIAIKDSPSTPVHVAKVSLTGNPLTDGYNQMSAGDLTGAIKSFSEAIKKNPGDLSARRYLAYTFLNDGQNAQAAAQFKALDSLQALTPDEELKYAKACKDANNISQAAIIYERHLKKIPNDINTRISLAQMYSDANAHARAQQVCMDGMMATTNKADYQKLKQFLVTLKQKWEHPNGSAPVDIGG